MGEHSGSPRGHKDLHQINNPGPIHSVGICPNPFELARRLERGLLRHNPKRPGSGNNKHRGRPNSFRRHKPKRLRGHPAGHKLKTNLTLQDLSDKTILQNIRISEHFGQPGQFI